MAFQSTEITNIPPRTSASKTLRLQANASEGNLALLLYGGWSEYKPEDIRKLIDGIQNYLDNLIPWVCEHCGCSENVTVPLDGDGFNKYPWVKCRECRRKTKRQDLGLDVIP